MMIESDLAYYERRIADEQFLAANASSPEAASAHRALAVIYADEVRRMRAATVPLRIVPSAERRGG